jgi:PAS domain S-box-containing protein
VAGSHSAVFLIDTAAKSGMEAMDAADRSQLLQVLHRRRDEIADGWYQALTGNSLMVPRTTQVRQHIAGLAERVIALLLAQVFERDRARAIGVDLARLPYVQPEVLGATQEVLARQLVEGLGADQMAALQPRLTALLSELAVGFLEQAHEMMLVEQEQIHRALTAARRRAEKALQQSEEKARALLNAHTYPTLLVETDGTIIALNEGAARRLGRRANELIGVCVFDLFPPDAVERSKAWIDQVVRSGRSVRVEDERGGRWFDQCIYPIFDAQEKVVQVAILALDITERKRAEEALREYADRLRILHDIDAAIVAAQSPQEISRAVLDHARQLIPYLGAGVVLFEFEVREGMVLLADGVGESVVRAGTRFSLDALKGVEVALEVLRRGEIYVTEKIDILAQALPELQALQAEGLRAVLIVPLIVQEELIGFLGLGAEERDVFVAGQVETVRQLAATLAIAIQQARLFESVRQQGERLRALTARLAEAEEVERQRVARDLHDLVGQNLNALGINLNLLRRHLPEATPELVRSQLDDSLALVQETSASIRRVMENLRPPMLDDFGLVATLHWYGAQFASRTGIAVTVQGQEPTPRLAAPLESALFRIVQEGLTNVAKHAQATQVTVTVAADDGGVRLVVADDGVGFNLAHLVPPDGHRGWGLITMAERAEAVGGCCRIESQPQQGTRVVVEVADSKVCPKVAP